MFFTTDGFFKGFKSALPIALGVASYGFVFGILSRQAGLDIWTSLGMSVFVFAGASQFVALDMWTTPLPAFTIIITTFVVNMRHILMGTVLVDRFKNLNAAQKYGSLFFMVDESWAFSLNQWQQGSKNAAILAGTGFSLFLAWNLSTIAGNMLGTGTIDPAIWGIDFSFTAIFIFLAIGLWRSRQDLIPWIVAAVVAILISKIFPGKWYILAGSISGSITGVFIHDR